MGAEWMVNWEQDANRGGVGMFDPRRNTVGLARRLETWLGVTGPSVAVGAACASANIAFGGPDLKTLMLTASTSVYTLRTTTAGMPVPWYGRR